MKLKNLLLAAVAVLGLASCNEGSNEYHSTYFYPLTANGIETYADQQQDSIRVMSYDTWTLNNTSDWLTVKIGNSQTNQIKVEIPAGYFNLSRLDLFMQPNTSGTVRTADLQVVSSYGKIGMVYTSVTQYPFLNITTPLVKKDAEGNYSFSLDLPQKTNKENATSFITFTVYTEDAQLTSSADWLTLDKTQGFTKSVKEKVTLTAQPNTTGAARSAQLSLTSGGVTSVITVNQPKASN